MVENMRIEHRKSIAGFLIATGVLSLGGCQFRPDVLSASSHSEAQEEIVRVTLRSVDARSIKSRQLYFSLVIVNCTGEVGRYPAEPTIEGHPVPNFSFPTDGDTVEVVGRVPARIYANYPQPCVLLEGGGYLTGTIKSSTTPIVRESGPNNLFKPNLLRKSA